MHSVVDLAELLQGLNLGFYSPRDLQIDVAVFQLKVRDDQKCWQSTAYCRSGYNSPVLLLPHPWQRGCRLRGRPYRSCSRSWGLS